MSNASFSIMVHRVLVTAAMLAAPIVAWSADLGLTEKDGTVMHDGKPYRGIGANYFDLFSRILKNPDDASSIDNLARLAKAGIPFVRFMGCGFWPKDMRLYLDDEKEYWRRMDLVVRAAEKADIGLIPSMFWCTTTVPDLMGEHVKELGNPKSKSVDFIRRYAWKMVERYKESPALWGWEFGNEYNLAIDLPEPEKHIPKVAPNLGTPPKRDLRDVLTEEELRVAEDAFCQTVRAQDPAHRLLFTGCSMPRSSEYHNAHEHSWKTDSAEEFAEMLKRDNSAGFDTITVHAYYSEDGKYGGGANDLPELIALAEKTAEVARKPLFVGEFGASRKDRDERARSEFEAALSEIVRSGVQIAAFWVFDEKAQDDTWNVEFDNDRVYQIRQVADANRKFHGPAP